MLIEFASGSCGCTVPEWPATPIAVGDSAEIKVVFNSKDKELGPHNNTVDLIANTEPIVTELKIRANVVE